MEAIIMPALGQTSDEATIQEWYFKEGDTVEMGDPLLSVENSAGLPLRPFRTDTDNPH